MSRSEGFGPDASDPITAILDSDDDAALAVIAAVEGPSYRPVGAMLAVLADTRVGELSSGCIEADVALHAIDAVKSRKPRVLRYGRGSPFIDIQLPCGGGLDVLLLPRPSRDVLREVVRRRSSRQACTLVIDVDTGEMGVKDFGPTGWKGNILQIRIVPDIRFLVFGKGPEAISFAALTHSVNFPTVLFSSDNDTRTEALKRGCTVKDLPTGSLPDMAEIDDRTAIVLFFHDHDREPPLLLKALETPAFYIGAQGSQRARDERHRELAALGAGPEAIARLRGPIGLIPSARDARTLAVSVLAEVLADGKPR